MAAGLSQGNGGLAPGVSLSDRHERYIRVHYYYYYEFANRHTALNGIFDWHNNIISFFAQIPSK